MESLASLSDNSTHNIPTIGADVKMWITLTILLLLFLSVFLFFIFLMLHAFITTAHLRAQTRYILFMYNLLNDTLNLMTCVLLFFLKFAQYNIPVSSCYVLVTIAGSTFLGSRTGLAVMALERYVAICFPLRHAVICRVERSWIAIMVSSAIGMMPSLIDIVILSSSEQRNLFLQRLRCARELLTVTPHQATMWISAHATTFAAVALIILYTYIKIVLEAMKVNGDKTSSSKASKTVMLHATQLLLSLTYFTAPISQSLIKNQVVYVTFANFFLFMLFPIFLSPLIYGIRDENFRNHMRTFFSCQPHKIKCGEHTL